MADAVLAVIGLQYMIPSSDGYATSGGRGSGPHPSGVQGYLDARSWLALLRDSIKAQTPLQDQPLMTWETQAQLARAMGSQRVADLELPRILERKRAVGTHHGDRSLAEA